MTTTNLKSLTLLLSLSLLAITQIGFGQSDGTQQNMPALEELKNYAYHQECSLTTTNSSRKWCTEVTLERIILQHYSWPTISDSSTFEKREKYKVTLEINATGKLVNSSISGGSNETVSQAILKAIQSAELSFIPAVASNGNPVGFVYELKLRAFDFMSRKKGPDEIQVPQELPEEEQEKINQDRNLTQYRMN